MKRTRLFILALLALLSLGGAARAGQSAALGNAIVPLEEGVPEVAIERLQNFLSQNPPLPEAVLARRKLAQALVRAGRLDEAL
ncbi:MAG: hypothetical protein ABIU29_04415, partial [Chthoniobacterales bacterium]